LRTTPISEGQAPDEHARTGHGRLAPPVAGVRAYFTQTHPP
jgi:hypothetical protein